MRCWIGRLALFRSDLHVCAINPLNLTLMYIIFFFCRLQYLVYWRVIEIDLSNSQNLSHPRVHHIFWSDGHYNTPLKQICEIEFRVVDGPP